MSKTFRDHTVAADRESRGQEVQRFHPVALGGELPGHVYASVLAAYGWTLLAAWSAFAGGRTDFILCVVSLVFLMFVGIPLVALGVAANWARLPRKPLDRFLAAGLETHTGPLTARQAWLQILVIPLALALTATLVGAAHAFFG